jgi:orotidine-5'-phosphate decarboxylase
MAGKESLLGLSRLEKELARIRPFKILCVTILTSWADSGSFPENLKSRSVSEHVLSFAQLVQSSGLSGLVCSCEELSSLSSFDFFFVTPGIRFDYQDSQDQKRVNTPAEAKRLGASAIVVGRPIIQDKNPKMMAQEFLKYLV